METVSGIDLAANFRECFAPTPTSVIHFRGDRDRSFSLPYLVSLEVHRTFDTFPFPPPFLFSFSSEALDNRRRDRRNT